MNFLRRIGLLACLMLSIIGLTSAQETTSEADFAALKTYLLEKTTALNESTAALQEASTAYYDLAAAADFDYANLWETEAEAVTEALIAAKEAWMLASPLYEQMEGIVAGVPSLSEYDVILDAGVSAEEDPEGAVPFDLELPDGTVLEKPGNLFGLLEATLWGTRPEFVGDAAVEADLNGNGELDFGEVLPDANMLKGSADLLASYTIELDEASQAWEPTLSDAFTALVIMTPTMSEYFGSWKESRFIAGDDATRSDFAVISRLSDIQDILGGLEVVYASVSPVVAADNAEEDEQIATGLSELRAYIVDLYTQEQEGRQFTAEEADIFGSEAQDQAQAIAGQVSQVAALLDIPLAE
jgi:hypothetical protein